MRNGLLQIADEIQPDKACIGTALSGFRRMFAVWKRMISHGAFCLSTAVYCGGWKKPARQHGIGIPNRNSAKTDFNTKGD